MRRRVCLGRFQQTFSRDDARTWGNRTLMTAVGGFPPPHSVMPELKLLANGALVLTGGRNGLFVWGCDGTKCVDEGGWQGVSITSWHNARCPQFNSNCSAGQPWLFPPLCLVSTQPLADEVSCWAASSLQAGGTRAYARHLELLRDLLSKRLSGAVFTPMAVVCVAGQLELGRAHTVRRL